MNGCVACGAKGNSGPFTTHIKELRLLIIGTVNEILFKNTAAKVNETSSFWPWCIIALELKYIFPKITVLRGKESNVQ